MIMINDLFQLTLADEAAMVSFGEQLATVAGGQGVVYLQGDLGMGKTTLSRGAIRGSGHTGSVKSPTYTLVEPYEVGDKRIYHFDLYRLADPEELEYLGIRDYFDEESFCLVEWPDKGKGILPAPDLVIELSLSGRGRLAKWHPETEYGRQLADKLAQRLA